MNIKKLLCSLAAMTMLFPLAWCGAEPDNEYGITPPDLTTEYVESGFLDYYAIAVLGDDGGGLSDAVYVGTRCGYRTLRAVKETAESVDVTLYYGGGVNKETPFISVEIGITGGDEEIHLHSIAKEEYLTEEYEIQFQEIRHDNKGYYEEKIVYNHSETVKIPMSYFTGKSGLIFFSAKGVTGDDRLCYGQRGRALYYTKEDGRIRFMSRREFVYVTDGSLIY